LNFNYLRQEPEDMNIVGQGDHHWQHGLKKLKQVARKNAVDKIEPLTRDEVL
jgi:hypothetical protein